MSLTDYDWQLLAASDTREMAAKERAEIARSAAFDVGVVAVIIALALALLLIYLL